MFRLLLRCLLICVLIFGFLTVASTAVGQTIPARMISAVATSQPNYRHTLLLIDADKRITYYFLPALRAMRNIYFSPDGSRAAILTGGRDLMLNVLDFETGEIFSTERRYNLGFSEVVIWSPNSQRLMFEVPLNSSTALNAQDTDERGIYVLDTQTREINQVFSGNANGFWSPDSQQIAYRHYGSISVVNADGSNHRQIMETTDLNGWLEWSPDGKHLVYQVFRSTYVADSAGEAYRELYADFDAVRWPQWSPDGRWLAFIVEQDGRFIAHTLDTTTDALYPLEIGHNARRVTWTDDGQHLIILADDGLNNVHSSMIFTSDVRGETVWRVSGNGIRPSSSPDGKQVIHPKWESVNGRYSQRLYLAELDATDTAESRPIMQQAGDGLRPVWWDAGLTYIHQNDNTSRLKSMDGRYLSDPRFYVLDFAPWRTP